MPFGTRVPYTILNKKRPGHTFSVHIVPLFGALIWPQNQFLHNYASAKIKLDTPKERKKFISVHLNNEQKNFGNSTIFKGVTALKSCTLYKS